MATKIQAKTNSESKKNSSALWDSHSLSEALGIDISKNVEITNVTIDSRAVIQKSLFIGIKGENHNGNFYAIDALEKGASLCIVDEMPSGAEKYKGAIILVDSSFEALKKIATYSRQRLKGKVIGVTGSMGKTSIKEMLRTALHNQGLTYATQGNLNNHYGLPLSLSNIHDDTEYAVLEMGMSAAGELLDLTKMAKPDIAIISNIAPSHIENFTSVSGIAAAKSEIFEGVQKGGYAIINIDNEYAPILLNKAQGLNLKIVTFAEKNNADFKLIKSANVDNKLEVTAECYKKDVHYTINTQGKHHAFNSLAVLAACYLAGAELEYSAHALKDFSALKGRGQVHHLKKGITLIDDSYNANPASMKASISALSSYKVEGRIIAVLGNMLGQTEQTHADLMIDIANNKVSKLYAVGSSMKALYEKLPDSLQGAYTNTSEEMCEILKKEIKSKDLVLVKGSNYMKMNLIVDSFLDA